MCGLVAIALLPPPPPLGHPCLLRRQGLVLCLVAMAHIRYRPSSAWLRDHERHLAPRWAALPPNAVARVAAAWARLRHQPVPLSRTLMRRAFLASAESQRARLFSQVGAGRGGRTVAEGAGWS